MNYYNTSNLITKSLDNTQDGFLNKWIEADKFFKTGLIHYGIYSNKSPVIECICYDVAKALGINSIRYDLINLHTKGNDDILEQDFIACYSKDFTINLNDDEVIISAYDFLKINNIKLDADLYKSLVTKFPEVRKDIDKMIIFDFIINNEDRHLNNFNFIVSADGKVKLAILFDNERSLFNSMDTSLYSKFLSDGFYNKQIDKSKPFRGHHYKQIQLIEKVSDINLNINVNDILDKYNKYLSESYINVINKLLEDRLEYVRKLSI